MLDRVRNTHGTAQKRKERKEKKKKSLVHANRRNRSYILTYKLFTGSFETVYSDTQTLPTRDKSRDPLKVVLMRRFNVRQKREAVGG